MKIIGISGSLRQASFNARLLRVAQGLLLPSCELEILSIANIPLYNEDLDGENKPTAVKQWLLKIETASALLIASPEYNYSIPGLLKNALDWASRPAFQSPLLNKPCGLISASRSLTGGARMQIDLKKVLLSTQSQIFPAIEYLLPLAHEKFDDTGQLTDATALRRLERYVQGFAQWAEKVS